MGSESGQLAKDGQLLQVIVEDVVVPWSPKGHIDSLRTRSDVSLDLLGCRVR